MAKANRVSSRMIVNAPNFQTVEFKVIGTAPLVQNAFSQKARRILRDMQEEGPQPSGQKIVREPKDFNAIYEGALHRSLEGWYGIPANAFRAAMVDSCRLTNLKMTVATQAVFVEADGFDADDGTPLVRILEGEPHYCEHMVKVGPLKAVDVRARGMFDAGWSMLLRIKFDADQFDVSDVAHLLMRAGIQVGIGEGRPFSPKGVGMGWGTFEVEGTA